MSRIYQVLDLNLPKEHMIIAEFNNWEQACSCMHDIKHGLGYGYTPESCGDPVICVIE